MKQKSDIMMVLSRNNSIHESEYGRLKKIYDNLLKFYKCELYEAIIRKSDHEMKLM